MLLGICKDLISFVVIVVCLIMKYLRLGWGLTGGRMASYVFMCNCGSVPIPT